MRHQTTTHIGIYSIFGGFLNVFEDTRLQQFQEVFSKLTFGELFSILIPFAIGIWAILHNEDNLDPYKTQRAGAPDRSLGRKNDNHQGLSGQRDDGASIKILD